MGAGSKGDSGGTYSWRNKPTQGYQQPTQKTQDTGGLSSLPSQLPASPPVETAPTQMPATPAAPTQLPAAPEAPTQMPATPAAPTQLPAGAAPQDNLRADIESSWQQQGGAPTQMPAETPAAAAPGTPTQLPETGPSAPQFDYTPSGNAPAYGTGDPDWQRQQQINQERAAGQIGESGLTRTEQGLMDAFRGASGAGDQYSKAWQGLNAMRGDAFYQSPTNPNVRVGTPEQAKARRELLNAARRKPRNTGPQQSLEERIAALRGRGSA